MRERDSSRSKSRLRPSQALRFRQNFFSDDWTESGCESAARSSGFNSLPVAAFSRRCPTTKCELHHTIGVTHSVRVPPRDSDKGKPIERWGRKVSGLTSESSTIAGPPESQSVLGLALSERVATLRKQ